MSMFAVVAVAWLVAIPVVVVVGLELGGRVVRARRARWKSANRRAAIPRMTADRPERGSLGSAPGGPGFGPT